MPLDDTTGYLKQQEQTADPFSLESVTKWLEQQDPATRYDYFNCLGRCLLGQYGAALGLPTNGPRANQWHGVLDRATAEGWAYHVTGKEPHTFGAALSRARALLASRKSA